MKLTKWQKRLITNIMTEYVEPSIRSALAERKPKPERGDTPISIREAALQSIQDAIMPDESKRLVLQSLDGKTVYLIVDEKLVMWCDGEEAEMLRQFNPDTQTIKLKQAGDVMALDIVEKISEMLVNDRNALVEDIQNLLADPEYGPARTEQLREFNRREAIKPSEITNYAQLDKLKKLVAHWRSAAELGLES
jgi:hypothetical protein